MSHLDLKPSEDVLEAILAEPLYAVARALVALGNNGASTSMGAIEAFGLVVMEGCNSIAAALDNVAEAIRTQKDNQ